MMHLHHANTGAGMRDFRNTAVMASSNWLKEKEAYVRQISFTRADYPTRAICREKTYRS
jgi:hypothetical protein